MLILQKKTGSGAVTPFGWDAATASNMTRLSATDAQYSGNSAISIIKTGTYVSTGKYFYEAERTNDLSGIGGLVFGFGGATATGIGNGSFGTTTSFGFSLDTGELYANGTVQDTEGDIAVSVGTKIGFAIDFGTTTMTIYKAGSVVYTINYSFAGTPALSPVVGGDFSTATHEGSANFTGPFSQTVPAGYDTWDNA